MFLVIRCIGQVSYGNTRLDIPLFTFSPKTNSYKMLEERSETGSSGSSKFNTRQYRYSASRSYSRRPIPAEAPDLPIPLRAGL